MKNFLRYILSLLCITAVLWNYVPAYAEEAGGEGDYGPDIFAETYCVIDGNTGEVLMSKDKDRPMYPASTTKVMTALLVLENVSDLSQPITFTETAVNVDKSSSTLEPKAMAGETMTVRDALYGMLLKSANECGAMLGEFVGGSEAAFAEMMNRRAAEIGCRNTHFANAYGIHNDAHYTSAYDLCLILREALKNPAYRKLNQTMEYTIPATNMCASRTFTMGHMMLNGAVQCETVPAKEFVGGKTGSTPQAGKVLVTAAEHDGLYTISSLMKSSAEHYYEDETVLLEYAYGLHDGTIWPVEWVPVNDTVVSTAGVRVRYSPSLTSAVYDSVPEGTAISRDAVYMNWSRVNINGEQLYICSDFLKSTTPELVPETTAYEFIPPETTAAPTDPGAAPETAGEAAAQSAAADMTDAEPTESAPVKEPETEAGTIPAGRPDNRVKLPVWTIFAVIAGLLILIFALYWVFFRLPEFRRKKKKKRRKKNSINNGHKPKNMLF